MELLAGIRRRVLGGDWSKRAARREHGIHWETLEKSLKHVESPGYGRSQLRSRSTIDPILEKLYKIVSGTFLILFCVGCGTARTESEKLSGPAASPSRLLSDIPTEKVPVDTTRSIADDDTSRLSPFEAVTDTTGIHFAYSSGRSAREYAIIESLGGGVGLFDLDLDGNLDVMFAGGGNLGNRRVTSRPCGLYRNLGNWRFEESTPAAFASAEAFFTHGIFPGDYDNDGFEDLAISGYGGVQLLKNMGDGTFVHAANLKAGPQLNWSSSLAWGDIDRDGQLDLYVANYVDWSWHNHPVCPGQGGVAREVCAPREFAGLNDLIFYNQNGEFTPADTEAIGIKRGGKGLGVVIVDLDQDQRVDIYVANDTTDNFLYVAGDDGFQENAVLAGASGDDAGVSTGSMGICVLDANGDSRPDLFVTNFERELSALYRNEGQNFFTYASRQVGFAAYESGFVGFGTVSVDFDFDGDQDIVVANGHVSYASPHAPFRQLPLLFENVDGERFKRISAPGYFSQPHSGRGLAAGDLDNDGAVDLVVSHLEERADVLRAKSKRDSEWIRVRLVGTRSNRDAVGAVVSVKAEDQSQTRFACGGGSYLSHCDRRMTFHVPVGSAAQSVTVYWPDSDPEVFEVPALVESVLREGTGTLLVE